jgi:electron transport complex protein RnfC
METFVHVSGTCIKTQGIFSIRIGTLIQNIAEECGGFDKQPELIIINGRVLGISVNKLDIPVTKYVKSIRFLQKTDIPDQTQNKCVRCGHCRSMCPALLEPDLLFAHVAGIKPASAKAVLSSVLCTNCALCNACCPARLPLSQFISFLKESYKTL